MYIVLVAFLGHVLNGDEPQGCAVDAVAETAGCSRAIGEDVTEVGIAAGASHLRAFHAVAAVVTLDD